MAGIGIAPISQHLQRCANLSQLSGPRYKKCLRQDLHRTGPGLSRLPLLLGYADEILMIYDCCWALLK